MKIQILLYLFIPFLFSCGQTQKTEIPILIENAKIIDGTGSKPIDNADILIENGKFAAIGKDLKVPKNAKRIDVRGKTVIPGLFDMHGHLYGLGKTQVNAYPQLYLANGVTNIFTPGEMEPQVTFDLKKAIDSGKSIGPRIFFGGPYFDTDKSQISWIDGVSDTLEILSKFNAWKGKMDGLKIYTSISKTHFDFVLKLAKKEGIPVTGHLGSIDTKYAIENGISGLEHGLIGIRDFGSDPRDNADHFCKIAELDLQSAPVLELIDLIVEKGVYVDPTNVIEEGIANIAQPKSEEYYFYLSYQAEASQRYMTKHLNSLFQESCVRGSYEKQLEFCRLIYKKGGIFVAGTDPVGSGILPGFGMIRELEIFVNEVGIPIPETIKIASLNGATVMGVADELGSISIGKKADFSIIIGDLKNDISLLKNIETVVKDGVFYDRKTILESLKNMVD